MKLPDWLASIFEKPLALLITIVIAVFALVFGIHQQQQSSFSNSQKITQSQVSEKPRDKTITYTAENGDTVASVAKKFSISEDTIRWENNLTTDTLTPNQTLRILPVTGVSYTVKAGDTLDKIAKQFKTTKQAIIDYPFNNFKNPHTFVLIPGGTIIIPDGKK